MSFGAGSQAKAPFSVFVSIAPQKYFVQKIGGNLVDVSVMIEAGASRIGASASVKIVQAAAVGS